MLRRQIKNRKTHKSDITTITSPVCQRGFLSVAVNIVYKLQFFLHLYLLLYY